MVIHLLRPKQVLTREYNLQIEIMDLFQAYSIGEEMVVRLYPYCQKLDIVGSCRRGKAEPKDIEITCVPNVKIIKDVFGDPMKEVRTKEFISAVGMLGRVIKGSVEDGKHIQIDLPQGIKLNLFMPESSDYFRHVAIRTGPDYFSKNVLAAGWRRIGWVGSDLGLRKKKDCIEKKKYEWKCMNKNGERPPVWQSEQEFFEWIKVEWIKPSLRMF